VGSYMPVLSCQVMNVITARGHDAGRAYLVADALGRDDYMPGSVLG
jgi:hypothetical protein